MTTVFLPRPGGCLQTAPGFADDELCPAHSLTPSLTHPTTHILSPLCSSLQLPLSISQLSSHIIQPSLASLRFKFFRQSNLALEELVLLVAVCSPKVFGEERKAASSTGSESRGKRDIDSQSGAALLLGVGTYHIIVSFLSKGIFQLG